MISPSIEKLEKWLEKYLNFERTPVKNIFWLETMKFLCQKFDNPQLSAKCIHVAGSKGKGSVSQMIARILSEEGYKVGIYSSPHIIDFRERICTAEGFLSEEIYAKCSKELIEGIESIKENEWPGQRAVTWFELVTLFSFLCFREAGTDFNVYEVGLGGRLDSTNVISPVLCVLCPIELEHTEFLGNTITAIAGEKAGIIKENVPVVVSHQTNKAAERVFAKKANECKSPIFFTDKEIKKSKSVYKTLHSNNDKFFDDVQKSRLTNGNKGSLTCMEVNLYLKKNREHILLCLQMLGSVQAQNAACAILSVKKILPNIKTDVIKIALLKAFLPGRFELVNNIKNYPLIPQLILDGAHTVNSIKFTMQTFTKLYKNKIFSKKENKPILLFACAADKDIEDIAPLFKNKFSEIILTIPGLKKVSNLSRAENAFKKNKMPITLESDYKKAIQTALSLANEKQVPLLVTGSFYLLSEVKTFLQN